MAAATENLPVAFAALLAGGLLLEHGTSTTKAAFQSSGSTSASASTGTLVSSGLTGAGAKVLQTLTGKASWFNHGAGEPGPGPADSGNVGQASGISFDQPGIAVYNPQTLKGWWRVTAPNGHVAVVQQTDVGPAPWTGRVIDLTWSALGLFGYSDQNLDQSGSWKLEYLGQTKPTS